MYVCVCVCNQMQDMAAHSKLIDNTLLDKGSHPNPQQLQPCKERGGGGGGVIKVSGAAASPQAGYFSGFRITSNILTSPGASKASGTAVLSTLPCTLHSASRPPGKNPNQTSHHSAALQPAAKFVRTGVMHQPPHSHQQSHAAAPAALC